MAGMKENTMEAPNNCPYDMRILVVPIEFSAASHWKR